jgi:hypothetical protein
MCKTNVSVSHEGFELVKTWQEGAYLMKKLKCVGCRKTVVYGVRTLST